MYANLSKMPPSLIFVGGDEIMLDDAVGLHKKLVVSGAKSELDIAESHHCKAEINITL